MLLKVSNGRNMPKNNKKKRKICIYAKLNFKASFKKAGNVFVLNSAIFLTVQNILYANATSLLS